MAAPSGTTWGSVVGDYGRIGISYTMTTTDTQANIIYKVWFWSKYSVSDTSNFFEFYSIDDTETEKNLTINTTVDTGSGWSTSNQQEIYSWSDKVPRKSSAQTFTLLAYLDNVDRVGGMMSASKSITIPALPTYTISYNANGGSLGNVPSSQTKTHGTTLTLSKYKPTRTGYKFKGWSTSKTATSATYQPQGSFTTNANTTLYAVWGLNVLTINYHINGGTVSSDTYYANDSLIYKKDTSSILNDEWKYNAAHENGLYNATTFGLTRTGYNFSGWKVGPSGTTVFGQDDTSVVPTDLTSDIKTGSCTITLYAVWTAKTYTVSYNANGGSGAPSSQTKTYGSTLTLSSTKPTRSGYTFKGWGTSASDTSVDYNAGGNYTSNSAITLYAIWEKTLTLSYNANGGTGAPNSASENIYNATTSKAFTISSTIPTRTGYSFLGWGTTAGATSATYSAGASVTLSDNLTLYAVWKINSYSLTIKPNGGVWNGSKDNSTITQEYNSTKAIEDPTWAGHTFAGWTLSGDGVLSGKTYTFGAGTGILTARWDTNDYVVTFDAGTNGGTINGLKTSPLEVEYDTAIGKLPTAIKNAYVFLGWFTAPSGGTKITSNYVVTGDITVYAQFEIDASAYINENSNWEEGVTYITDSSGKPIKGKAKTRVNGVWKDGFCK